MDVIFSPTLGGSREAELSVTTNDPDSPILKTDLTGKGIGLDIIIKKDPESITKTVFKGFSGKVEELKVWSGGKDTLNYAISISKGKDWLSCYPTNGTSTGEKDPINVSFQSDDLGEGNYSGEITISDPQAQNNPQTVPVNLKVVKSSIRIKQGKTVIPVEGNYDFGAIEVGSEKKTTFTIENLDKQNEYTVSVGMVCSFSFCDFQMSEGTDQIFLKPGGSAKFDITFNPKKSGSGWIAIEIREFLSFEYMHRFFIRGKAEGAAVGLNNVFIADYKNPAIPITSCTEGDQIVLAIHLDYESDNSVIAKVKWTLQGENKKILKGKFIEILQGSGTYKKTIYLTLDLKKKLRKQLK